MSVLSIGRGFRCVRCPIWSQRSRKQAASGDRRARYVAAATSPLRACTRQAIACGASRQEGGSVAPHMGEQHTWNRTRCAYVCLDRRCVRARAKSETVCIVSACVRAAAPAWHVCPRDPRAHFANLEGHQPRPVQVAAQAAVLVEGDRVGVDVQHGLVPLESLARDAMAHVVDLVKRHAAPEPPRPVCGAVSLPELGQRDAV